MRVGIARIGTGIATRVEFGCPASIDEDVTRLIDLLRELLGFRVLLRIQGEFVRMMGDDELAMSLLDLVVAGSLGKPEYFECF